MKRIKHFALLIAAVLMCLYESSAQLNFCWNDNSSSSSGNTLYGVRFADDTTGFIVGTGSTILHSGDGGKTWNQQTTSVNTDLYGITFSDPKHGWIVGYGGKVLHTEDGGITWNPQALPTNDNILNAVFSIDSNTAWISALTSITGAGIYYTKNGGETWTGKSLGLCTWTWNTFFVNADTGFAVAGLCGGGCSHDCQPSDSGGYILRSFNGGETWDILEHYEDLNGLYAVVFTDDSTGTVVGAGGTILHTTDGGENWSGQPSGTTKDLWDIFFLNPDTAVVVGGTSSGDQGVMLTTANGGISWEEQSIPTTKGLFKVVFINNSIGTAVGGGGTILYADCSVGIEEESQDGRIHNGLISESYPNPFIQTTTISFRISAVNHVTLKIYNLHGQEIAILLNEDMAPGSHEIKWNAGNVPDGMYLYKLIVGNYIENGKLLLSR